MELSQVLGYIATIIFSAMYIPQIWKTIKTQSVADVSLPMFIMGFIANIDALCYATMIHQKPLQIKYSIALVAIGIYIAVYFKMKNKESTMVDTEQIIEEQTPSGHTNLTEVKRPRKIVKSDKKDSK